MASIRARKPDSSANFKSRRRVSLENTILRIIEKQASGFGGQALAAFGVGGEKLAQMQRLDFLQ